MLKFLSSKKPLTLSLIVVFLFSITGTIFGTTNVAYAASKQHYGMVALGDSLAAGQNPNGAENGYGYANAIHNYLAKEGVAGGYWNFGVSGMTSQQLKDALPENQNDTTYDSKIVNALTKADTKIITIDIGADDLLPLIQGFFEGTVSPDEVNAALFATNANIATILVRVHALNPGAQIYLMGYYDALVNYLTPAQDYYFNQNMLTPFNTNLQYVIVPTANAYFGGNFVSFVPTNGFVTQLHLPGDIHPNRAGYINIADQFWDEITIDFLF